MEPHFTEEYNLWIKNVKQENEKKKKEKKKSGISRDKETLDIESERELDTRVSISFNRETKLILMIAGHMISSIAQIVVQKLVVLNDTIHSTICNINFDNHIPQRIPQQEPDKHIFLHDHNKGIEGLSCLILADIFLHSSKLIWDFVIITVCRLSCYEYCKVITHEIFDSRTKGKHGIGV